MKNIFFVLVLVLMIPNVVIARVKASSVTAANNSAGLELILDCSTREEHVSVSVVAGANATVTFETSVDRVNWDVHTTLLSVANGTALLDMSTGMPHVKLKSTTAAVALDYRMGCK